MNHTKEVAILITCDEKSFPVATMAFDTIRTGFPTALIKVYANDLPIEMLEQVFQRFSKIAGPTVWLTLQQRLSHSEWIRAEVIGSSAETLFIVDGDTVFWESCEHFRFDSPLAGLKVPNMWNEFAQCPSMERVHTSHMTIRPEELRQAIAKVDKTYGKYPVYAEADYFSPRIVFQYGLPTFYDSLAQLSQAVKWYRYGETELNCYDHVNSASFYDVMYERLEQREKFAELHELARTNPAALRGLWRKVNKYYEACAARLN
jgi:hypothetical protein